MRMKARSNITTRAPEAERGPGGNSESAPANLRPGLEKPLRRRRHGGPRKPASRPGGTTAQAQTRWPTEACVLAWRNHCAGADTVAHGSLRPGLEKPLRRRRHGGPRRNHCAGTDTAAHGSLRPGLEEPLRRRRHGARPPARGPAAAL